MTQVPKPKWRYCLGCTEWHTGKCVYCLWCAEWHTGKCATVPTRAPEGPFHKGGRKHR